MSGAVKMETDVAELLRRYADDPMWADHAEVPKSLLRAAIIEIERLREQVTYYRETP